MLGIAFNHGHDGAARPAKIEPSDAMLAHEMGDILPCNSGGQGLCVNQQKGLVLLQAGFERERGAAAELDLGVVDDDGGIAVYHILARAFAIARAKQGGNGIMRRDDAVFCAAVCGTLAAARGLAGERSIERTAIHTCLRA